MVGMTVAETAMGGHEPPDATTRCKARISVPDTSLLADTRHRPAAALDDEQDRAVSHHRRYPQET